MPDGWPDDWDERKAGRGCVLCSALGAGDSDHWAFVGAGRYAETFLERRSALAGYCVVVWSGRHVAEPTELDDTEAGGYWREVLVVGRALQQAFEPLKVNYLTLGNTVPHLHTHVVPRYQNDPAPAGPLPWADIFQDQPVAEAELHQQAARLRSLGVGDRARRV